MDGVMMYSILGRTVQMMEGCSGRDRMKYFVVRQGIVVLHVICNDMYVGM